MFSHTLLAAPGPPVSPLSGGRGDDEAEALITHYPLDGLLPPGHSLAFHRGLGTLAHLTIQQDRALVPCCQQFTEAEITLLVPLLDHYPHHGPYEVLWTSFAWNTTEQEAVTRARPRLQAALEQGGWEEEMRPVRNAISRTRLKLNRMGLDVLGVFHLGSILVARPALRQGLVHQGRARKTMMRRCYGRGAKGG
jgi:hypothetical protein